MKHTKLGLLASAVVTALTMGACSRAHLSKNYGIAYAAWFSAQQVEAKPANAERARRTVESLDAQEAAMVSKSYRKEVSKSEDASGSRMLMIGQPRSGGEGYIPPPSVPDSSTPLAGRFRFGGGGGRGPRGPPRPSEQGSESSAATTDAADSPQAEEVPRSPSPAALAFHLGFATREIRSGS